jgi:dihydropteroate synthase
MHMQGEPQTMQHAPRYGDVAVEVREFLAERIAACEAAGISRERLVADPGFGFGKTVAHNLTLLKRLPEFAALGVPLLAGWSRKSSIGRITGREPGERLAGSLAAALLALLGGARILRVHDVRETRDAVLMFEAWRQA